MDNSKPSLLEKYGVVWDGYSAQLPNLTEKEATEFSKNFQKDLKELASFYNKCFEEVLE